jgi:hypothetical protein
MELFVYKGEYNLPSVDFDCLRVLVSQNNIASFKTIFNFSIF